MNRHSGTKQKKRFHVIFRATIKSGYHSDHWNHLVTVIGGQKSLCQVERQQDASNDIIVVIIITIIIYNI
jgi:hypothetical protein